MSDESDKSAAGDDLAGKIAASPEDIDLYRVYGDLLQSRGDPRGELIALHCRVSELEALEREADALFAQHREALEGPLAPHQRHIDATWKLGFIAELTCSLAKPSPSADDWAAVLGELLSHPSGRFLRRLSIECDNSGGRDPHDLAPIVAILAELDDAIPLRALRLGPRMVRAAPYRRVVDAIGNVDRMLESCSQLEELGLTGHVELSALYLPALRTLELVCDLRQKTMVTALEKAALPQLESLALHIGYPPPSTWWKKRSTPSRLFSADLAQLGELKLWQCPPEVAQGFLDSAIVGQLHAVTIALTTSDDPTDPGPGDKVARALIDRIERFAALRELDLSKNLISAQVESALRELPIEVKPGPVAGVEQFVCSFCGKSQQEVARVVAGPSVFICDECIGLCAEIIAEEVE